MILKDLFEGIKYELIKGDIELEINDIVYDSRKVNIGNLFMAIVGNEIDGHKYIEDAIKSGARAIVISEDKDIKEDITVIKVEDTRKILSKLSMRLFKYPQNKMKTIAITGTKGKTTVSFMIKKILEDLRNNYINEIN